MEFKTREFYPNELRALKTLKTQTEKSSSKFKFYHFFLATFMGIIFAYLATLVNKNSIWLFI